MALSPNERNRVIDNIEQLYPPDIHEEGRELLIQALCLEWRDLPDEVLLRLHGLCIEMERR